MPRSRSPHGIQFDSPLQRQWMMRSSNGRIALNAATVLGASASSKRAANHRPDATISSTLGSYLSGPDDQCERDDAGACEAEQRPHVESALAEGEVVADDNADRHQHDEDDPPVGMPVRDREVVREHREDDGEREVVVVNRALLSAQRPAPGGL